MWWYIIPGITGILALSVIALVLKRVFPRLVVIDVATIPGEREAARKRQIVLERAERLRASIFLKLRLRLRPFLKALREQFEHLYARAKELERRHRHIDSGAASEYGGHAAALIEEGRALLREGNARQAEQKFIEAINLSPREAKAYEELGRLYMREKQWTEAGEAFAFLLKINSRDASAHADLGELAMAQGMPAEAIPHFNKAVSLRPANPRLVSLLLDSAIAARNKELALKTYARLKEISPQFPGLADFEERIKRM
ncbi:tetratricopeptide repeat protein [Patescibacteria group bacterium]|nr:MAG: tetratricopeptide repeat protein [Patescibacteria group bacterium]